MQHSDVKTQVSTGTAGLIMVCLSILSLIPAGGNLVLWFIGTFGAIVGTVGLVFCVVALFTGSGRPLAGVGLLGFCLLGALRVLAS